MTDPTTLLTRLLALAELAVDAAQLVLDYGDPEDRYIYRELQELANRGNRNYCLSRISTARRQAAAGVRNAWLQVPTECLY